MGVGAGGDGEGDGTRCLSSSFQLTIFVLHMTASVGEASNDCSAPHESSAMVRYGESRAGMCC